MKWTYQLGDTVYTATWADGILDDPYLDARCHDLTIGTEEEVEIWWGMWFGEPTLDIPEGAWGTIRHTLEVIGATVLEQPEPPFEPPFEEGDVY
jgi:hypothetical protein